MNKKIYSLLSLKPFNEDKDKDKLDNSETPVIRSLIIIISFVFALFSFGLIIIEPSNDSALMILGIALSLKAIEVLINWHLGLKNIAKNGLILIILLTFVFVYLKNF